MSRTRNRSCFMILAALIMGGFGSSVYWVTCFKPANDFERLLAGDDVSFRSLTINVGNSSVVLTDPDTIAYLNSVFHSATQDNYKQGTFYQAIAHFPSNDVVVFGIYFPDDENCLTISFPINALFAETKKYNILLEDPLPDQLAELFKQLR